MQFCCHFLWDDVYLYKELNPIIMEANTILKAKQSSYQTRRDAFGNLWVQNTSNSLINVWPKNLNCQLNDYRHQLTAQAFKQALGIERLRKLDSEKEWLTTNYVLSASGEILEIEFTTTANTSLTIDEIEALEITLKDNVSFNITWLDTNEADFVTMSAGLPYSTVLSICLGPNVATGPQLKKISTTVAVKVPPLPDHFNKH